MFLIKGKKNDAKGAKKSFQVTMQGVVVGEQRTSEVSYTVSEASAQSMVDSLVAMGVVDRKGETTLVRVNTGFMGVMNITDVQVVYFDKKGNGRDITISPLAEATGDVDGCWTAKESKQLAKRERKAARKAKAVELDD